MGLARKEEINACSEMLEVVVSTCGQARLCANGEGGQFNDQNGSIIITTANKHVTKLLRHVEVYIMAAREVQKNRKGKKGSSQETQLSVTFRLKPKPLRSPELHK